MSLLVKYLLSRVGQAVVVVWAAYTLTFAVLYLLPGDPVSIMLNSNADAGAIDEAMAAELRAKYGFDKSPALQYFLLLGRAVQGDFGTSVVNGAQVTSLISEVFPETLKLASLGLGFALVLGGGVALASIWFPNPKVQNFFLNLPSLGISVPTFWVGLLLLQLLSFRVPIFPAVGNEGVLSLILPALTLAIPLSAIIAQVLADSLHSTWGAAHVDTALAKGASRTQVLSRHVGRNAIIPTLTIVGVLVGNVVAGSVVVETVFSRAGFGRLIQNSVQSQDIPVIQGFVVIAAVIFVAANLIVDLIYPLADPRIRTGHTALAA